jgi:arginyl-tRNA synthetase
VQVLTDEANLKYRIALVESVTIVLKESLRLLGMKAPEEM